MTDKEKIQILLDGLAKIAARPGEVIECPEGTKSVKDFAEGLRRNQDIARATLAAVGASVESGTDTGTIEPVAR